MKTKNTYVVPACVESTLNPDRVICASFDSSDSTEIWTIEDPETI